MNKILENIQRIGHVSAVLCVLKGLRAKIELNEKMPNRLGRHFPSLKGIILTGRAGTGKTHVMRQVYDGLNLSNQIACWVDGGATTVGRREKFKENPHSVIFWNEIGCNDLADVRLLKQITEGRISYMKHGDLDETKFTGLLIGCTNDFSATGRVGRDLEALRDRMDIVEVGAPPGYNPLHALEAEKHYFKPGEKKVNWELIKNALIKKECVRLTVEEIGALRPFWARKIRECLDGRVLTRAGKDFLDCFTFCKRFFGSLEDKEVFDTAIDLAYESVNLSSIAISNLTIVQRDIIEILKGNVSMKCSTDDIKNGLIARGRFLNKSSMFRSLNKLISSGFIIRYNHGEYSLLQKSEKSTKKVLSEDELLRILGR
jgi:hypothetical protein